MLMFLITQPRKNGDFAPKRQKKIVGKAVNNLWKKPAACGEHLIACRAACDQAAIRLCFII